MEKPPQNVLINRLAECEQPAGDPDNQGKHYFVEAPFFLWLFESNIVLQGLKPCPASTKLLKGGDGIATCRPPHPLALL